MSRAPRNAARRLHFDTLEERALLSTADLLVGFAGGAPSRAVRTVLDSLGATVEPLYPGGPGAVTLPEGADIDAAAARLAHTRGVRYAEPDRTIHVAAAATAPNDPRFTTQWGLESAKGVDVNALDAWGVTTGSSSVIVAVIDSGVDVTHPDLVGSLWVNPGEVAGNRLDDDHNGKVDDVNGWNFITNTSDLIDDEMDGHGTHIAGIIAATPNNGQGISGIAPGVKLMALKFIDATGNGDTADAVKAIYYAVANKAKVINASWAGDTPDNALRDAINYAAGKGVVFVTAAGNEGSNNDVRPAYPASYRLSNMIVVAAVDDAGKLASFSNYGKKTVDIAAPGVNIVSTIPGNRYASYSGTSMATPFVSGVVALLAGRAPNLSAAQLVQRVLSTARPLAALANRTVTGGIVDAYRALASNTGQSTTPTQQGDEARAGILGSNTYYTIQGGTTQKFVSALYLNLLGRAVDPASLTSWTNQILSGVSRTNVARSILTLDEARRTQVARWFISDLGYAPSSLAMLKNHASVLNVVRQIDKGVSLYAGRAYLLVSDTYYNRQGGTDAGYVTGLFQTLYGRAPSAFEQSSWTAKLSGGSSRNSVVQSLMNTAEGRETAVARWYQGDLGITTALDALKRSSSVQGRAAATPF